MVVVLVELAENQKIQKTKKITKKTKKGINVSNVLAVMLETYLIMIWLMLIQRKHEAGKGSEPAECVVSKSQQRFPFQL